MVQLSAASFKFLDDLKKNNNRSWFEANKDAYIKQHSEIVHFAEALHKEMNKFDRIETPSGKKSLKRIYRDIRFSKDKTPYKTHWGGSFSRAGKDKRGGYYFHLERGNTFVGGGFWEPSAKDLLHIRNQINLDAKPLLDVISTKKFKTYFGTLQGDKLKSAPKGFDKENENIDLLNHKQFIVWHQFSNDEVLEKDFHKKIAAGFKNMLPFFDVMSNYLSTDLNGESLFD